MLKNALLLLAGLVVYKIHYSWNFKFRKPFTIVSPVIVMAIPFILNPVTNAPADDLESPVMITDRYPPILRNGVRIDLTRGKHVIAMLSTSCPHCVLAAQKLGVMQLNKEIPDVVVYFMGDEKEVGEFFKKARYSFPYAMWNENMFLRITEGIFPVILVAEDGKIKRRLRNFALTPENINKP